MKEDENKTLLYRAVFCDGEGPTVLADMLNELGHFNMHKTSEADVALSNFANWLLWRIGAYQEKNVFEIARKYTELDPSKEK
jgi:hypothetical protein